MATIVLIIALAALAATAYVAVKQNTINGEMARQINLLHEQLAALKKTPQPAAPVADPGTPAPQEAPVVERPSSAGQPPAPAAPQTVYLSRPDEAGTFTRAAATMLPGNSIFILTTARGDATRGTFAVIDDRSVHAMALMMPTLNLAGACTGPNIQVSDGAVAIVTDKPGEAVLTAGQWRVTVPATIHYVK